MRIQEKCNPPALVSLATLPQERQRGREVQITFSVMCPRSTRSPDYQQQIWAWYTHQAVITGWGLRWPEALALWFALHSNKALKKAGVLAGQLERSSHHLLHQWPEDVPSLVRDGSICLYIFYVLVHYILYCKMQVLTQLKICVTFCATFSKINNTVDVITLQQSYCISM